MILKFWNATKLYHRFDADDCHRIGDVGFNSSPLIYVKRYFCQLPRVQGPWLAH